MIEESGSGRPQNIWILRIRIRIPNTDVHISYGTGTLMQSFLLFRSRGEGGSCGPNRRPQRQAAPQQQQRRQQQLPTQRHHPGRVGKTRVLKKKPSPVFFFCFFGFSKKKYICPEERVFRVFSVSRILLGASSF